MESVQARHNSGAVVGRPHLLHKQRCVLDVPAVVVRI